MNIDINNLHNKNIGNIKKLINNGLDINKLDKDGNTLIINAVRYDNKLLVQLLLENGADVNIKDRNGDTILSIALFYIHEYGYDENILTELLKYDIDVNIKNKNGETPLIYAIKKREYLSIKLLLKYGADVNIKDDENKTPLMYAIIYAINNKNIPLIELLLEHNADVNIKDNDGNSSLMYAINIQSVYSNKIFDLLVEKGGDINTYNNKFETPLLLVCTEQLFNKDLIKYLFDRPDIEINGNKYYKNTPIMKLSEWNIINSQELFYNKVFIVKYQPDLNNDIVSCLINSLYNSSIKKIALKIIINNIKLINEYYCIDGSESLILACEYEYLSIIDLLLNNYNTNIEICNNNGETPLLIACKKCNYKIVQLLLYHKANIYCSDYAGNTPFKNIYVNSNCKEKYKKILYSLKKYKDNNINITGSKKIGIIAGHGCIDKSRFCRIPDGINIFTDTNKGDKSYAMYTVHKNNIEKISYTDKNIECYYGKNNIEKFSYTDKNIECYNDKNKRKFCISKPGKFFKSGTIIHDIYISFILGWDEDLVSINNINEINKINIFGYSGIITDSCKYMKFNTSEMNNFDKIDEMLKYNNKKIIPNNILFTKNFYLSEVLNSIKKNSISKDINTFIIRLCRSADFTNNNKSPRHPEFKLFRINSGTSNYQKDFGNNLINDIKLITEKDLLANTLENTLENTNEEFNISSLSFGLGLLDLNLDENKKFNYEKTRVINKLLNESYIDIKEFRFILNIKNKKISDIKLYLKKLPDININNNEISLPNNLDNYTISDIYNKNKRNVKKFAKLDENIKSEKIYNKIYNKKLHNNIINKIARIIEPSKSEFIINGKEITLLNITKKNKKK